MFYAFSSCSTLLLMHRSMLIAIMLYVMYPLVTQILTVKRKAKFYPPKIYQLTEVVYIDWCKAKTATPDQRYNYMFNVLSKGKPRKQLQHIISSDLIIFWFLAEKDEACSS